MTRIIVYTGKGGVGKTTVAAASALLCAQRGHRTLIVSTDIADSLGDAFETKVGPEPGQLDLRGLPGVPRWAHELPLWAQETDVVHTIRRYWGAIQDYFAQVFQWRGLNEIVAEEMTVLPGLDEVVSLLQIVDHHDSGEYDVIVVDAAPTGETVRLLALPEAARWWLDHVFPIQRRATELAAPMIRRLTGMPMPDDAVFRAGEDLFRKLDRMRKLLSDPGIASLRIVLNLERMVIEEAKRSYTYFNLFEYPTDLVICNRVLRGNVGDYFAGWQRTHEERLDVVTEAFTGVNVRVASLRDREVQGVQLLADLGAEIFREDDPSTIFPSERPFSVKPEEGGFAFVLKLHLEVKDKDTVHVRRRGEELVVEVGPWRRNLILPRLLADLPHGEAEFSGGDLRIHFERVQRPRGEARHARTA